MEKQERAQSVGEVDGEKFVLWEKIVKVAQNKDVVQEREAESNEQERVEDVGPRLARALEEVKTADGETS